MARPLAVAEPISDNMDDECGRWVQGRHPLQTFDALGAADVQPGPEASPSTRSREPLR